jgi:hypothetical protein
MTLADLKRLAANGTVALTPASGVSLKTDTPDGYKLIHPGYRRRDYLYDSDWVYQDDVRCSPGCALKAETAVQLRESVEGLSSHFWHLQYNARNSQNPGHLTWQYRGKYYCGVNKGGSDPECSQGASDSGSEASFDPGEVFGKTWGSKNSITVFPMVALSTHFNTGIVVTTKFRGYDTLSRSRTTRLNTHSGDGS